MGTHPQDVPYLRVQVVTVTAGGQDRVVGTETAQGAVRELGGERGITAGDAALGEQ
jgi:hypothetical protein